LNIKVATAVYSYNSFTDPELTFGNNNNEITSMEFVETGNVLKKNGIRKLLAIGRAFNTYYSPYTGTVELHSYDTGKGKTAVLQNYRQGYYMGTELDGSYNILATVLSAKNINNKNLINLYSLSSYYRRNIINPPLVTPTPSETPSVTPTPSPTSP